VEGAPATAKFLAQDHPSWFLDPFNLKTGRTGSDGDLIVTLKEQWAFGRAVGDAPASGDGVTPVSGQSSVTPSKQLTNPYLASGGGPRNRAVALLMDGPATRDRNSKAIVDMGADAMQVKSAVDKCDWDRPVFEGGTTFGAANDPTKIGDDANAIGHECQPETVDIPFTIAALFNLGVQPQNIATQARFLNEAFIPDVGFRPTEEIVEDAPPPDPPPPPDPEPIIIINNDVQVIPVRPPKDPFPFHGLLRRLSARVTDAKGRAASKAGRGAKLSTIEVRGDFGKPQTLVRLTFYKPGRKAASGGRTRMVAIARFKPFTVKRGPVKLRLQVPDQFAPTHLGLVVQEVKAIRATTAANGKPASVLKPIGAKGGGIVQIGDAPLLHRTAGAGRRK
jgi:hypothetical protein